MKKYIYLLIMVLISVSCKETDTPLESPKQENTPSKAPGTLYAIISKAESRAVWDTQPLSWEGIDCVDSRTYAKPEGIGDEYYNQYWSSGDAISYFETTQNLKYTSDIVGNNDEYIANFTPAEGATGTGEALNTGYYYGVYPYKEDTQIDTDGTVTFTFPEIQDYCKDSYANGFNGMIARHQNADEDLYFLNFCSYLQLKLKTNDSEIAAKDIDKIVLKANNQDDFLSGVGTITFNSEGFPEVTMDHEKSINHLVLNCRNQKNNLGSVETKFWFVLPGGFTFTKGFNITVSFTDGTYIKKWTKENIGAITIDRNHIKPLATLTPTKGDLFTSVIRYKYETDTDPGKEAIEFAENVVYFRDEAGNPLTPHTFYNSSTEEYEITFNGHLYSIEKNTFDTPTAPDIDFIFIENSTAIDIKDFAFWNCTAETITIDNDIISIGFEAFGMSNLEDLTINGDIHTIDTQAFLLSDYLETVVFNGAIEHIDEEGFSGSSLTSIYVLKRINNIGSQGFYMCSFLKNISLPYVEHIEDKAFIGCKSLETIDLHGVHRIGISAFNGCTSLRSVCISRDCKEIGEGAFIGLKKLKNVYLYASQPPKLNHATGQDNPYVFELTTKIHIPEESLDAYLQDKDWKYYYDKDMLIADITPEDIKEHFGEDAH